MNDRISALKRFGPFLLDVDGRELRRDGQIVPLAGKPFELLVLLAENSGRVLTKGAIMESLWPGVFVDEANLTQTVFMLRKALGQEKENGSYVLTVPRRGYKFVFPEAPASIEMIVEEQSETDLVLESEPGVRGPSRRMWLAGAGLSLAVPAGVWSWSRGSARTSGNYESIVVLPFVNLSGAGEEEYLSDGFTEEIIGALAAVPGLKVVARASAFQYKGKAVDVRELGARMRAEAVLEGSVRKEGDRLRITARLSSVRDGFHLWSKAWDRTMGGIISTQQEVAREVALTLRPNAEARQVVRAYSRNPEAYQDYLRGRFHWRRSMNKPHRMKAIQCFEAAVEKDPKFAAAYAGIADSYQWLGYSMQLRAREVYSKAISAADRALELEPNLAYARAVRGFIRFAFDWNWSGAEREFLHAIELDPADPAPHQKYSYYLTAMHRHRESLEQGRIAIDLDPLDAALHAHYAWAYLLLPVPDTEKAQLACSRALELDPVSPPGLWFSAMAYEVSGEFDKAVQRLEQLGYSNGFVRELREATAKFGAKGYWSTRERRKPDVYLAEIRKAMMACGMREKDEALAYLERAYEEREPQLAHMYNCPYLRVLRGDTRFERLASKVGVPRPA